MVRALVVEVGVWVTLEGESVLVLVVVIPVVRSEFGINRYHVEV